MVTVKNNDIYFARGETATLKFQFWTMDGKPYILPPKGSEQCLNNYANVYVDGELAPVVIDVNARPAYKISSKTNSNTITCVIAFMNPLSCVNLSEIVVNLFSEATTSVQSNLINTSIHLEKTFSATAALQYMVTTLATSGQFFTGVQITFTNNYPGNNIYLEGVELWHLDRSIPDKYGFVTLIPNKGGTGGMELQKAAEFPVCALTVKSGSYDSIVLAKYLNLSAPPMYEGHSDYSLGGYNKFTTDEIYETGTTSVPNSIVKADIDKGIYKIYHSKSGNRDIYELAILTANDYRIVSYVFNVIVPINFDDTEMLESKEYIYDVIAYIGTLKNPDVLSSDYKDFPFSKVMFKRELIQPHKFVLKDTNNA